MPVESRTPDARLVSSAQGEFPSQFHTQRRHSPCGGCQTIGAASARVVLDIARRNHAVALVEALAGGVPLAELARDGDAFSRAVADALAEGGAP